MVNNNCPDLLNQCGTFIRISVLKAKTGTATDSRWAVKIGAVMNPVSCRLKLWKDLQRRMSDAMKSARILIFSTDPIMYLHECICFLGRCQLQVTDPRHQEGRGKDLNSLQERRNVGALQWVSGSLLRLPTPTAQRFLALKSQGVFRSWWKQLKVKSEIRTMPPFLMRPMAGPLNQKDTEGGLRKRLCTFVNFLSMPSATQRWSNSNHQIHCFQRPNQCSDSFSTDTTVPARKQWEQDLKNRNNEQNRK